MRDIADQLSLSVDIGPLIVNQSSVRAEELNWLTIINEKEKMLGKIKTAIEKIEANKKPIKIISHFDTDGITSAAIFSKAMSRAGKEFSLEITKSLEENFIEKLRGDALLIFLDLASGSLEHLAKLPNEVIILDHHEIVQKIPDNVFMVNPTLEGFEQMSSAAICYLFAKQLGQYNRDLAHLAVIGMVGDLMEKNIGKKFSEILADSETVVKKGLLIYPSTRPLNKALEYSSSPFIPGVTGSREGVFNLLRDAGFLVEGGRYKALYELTEDEMTRLVTAIMLKNRTSEAHEELVGNLFLVKFFNKLEDARELSALINSCSRMDYPDVALGFCLGNRDARVEAERVYIDYKQSLVSALKYVSESEKICGKDYVIINGKDKIKDTIIGTVASIVSHSPLYPKGQIIVALAYNQERIKVSARMVGKEGRNVRDVLHRVVVPLGGEVGGHPNAAGCLIAREQEQIFIEELRKILDVEVIGR